MSNLAFLPDDYAAPSSGNSNYMKLQDGENKLRILSQPIIGWLDWDEKQPVRFRYNDRPSKPIDAARPVKHFWAFLVWNYALETVQILEITQASIRDAIEGLCNDEEWGQPYFYDLKITRKGKEKETTYAVNPMPRRPVGQKAKEAFQTKPCQLERLFDGEDPWSGVTAPTPGIFDESDLAQVSAKSQKSQLEELLEIVAEEELTITYVDEFLAQRAAKAKTTKEKIIEGALVKDLTKYFLKEYAKWLKEAGKEQLEPVPF
jgi:hypothetical protein